MKFIVSSSVLLKNLATINGVIAANPIVPILENFLFRIVIDDKAGGILTVTSSDLQTTMTTQVPVDASEGGAIAIPAKLLLDTLRSLSEQPITFQIDTETFGIQILTDNGVFKISGENAIDYPKLPKVNQTGQLVLSSDALLMAINRTVFATSDNDLKPAMTGVLMSLNSDRAEFVATDGNRLIRYRRTDITSTAHAALIIPKKALTLLKGALPEAVDVTVRYSLANALFSFGSVTLTCRLIDENYPDFDNAIPKHNPNVMAIGRVDLLTTIKRILIYSNRTTHQVRLTLTDGQVTISAEDLDYANEATETLLCEYEGDKMEIGFNAKLVGEMLGNLSAKMVKVELSTPNRAGLIIPLDHDECEDILMMAMPLMLATYQGA